MLNCQRKKKRGEREGGQKEEDEAVYEQLLSLLAPGKRRKTRKPRRQRLPSADRPQPLPDQHELETDQHRPQAGVGETEEGEEGDGVRAEEVSGDKSEDGGEAEVSDGEEREAETGDVPSTGVKLEISRVCIGVFIQFPSDATLIMCSALKRLHFCNLPLLPLLPPAVLLWGWSASGQACLQLSCLDSPALSPSSV